MALMIHMAVFSDQIGSDLSKMDQTWSNLDFWSMKVLFLAHRSQPMSPSPRVLAHGPQPTGSGPGVSNYPVILAYPVYPAYQVYPGYSVYSVCPVHPVYNQKL